MSKTAYGVVVYKAALADKGLTVDDALSTVPHSTLLDETEHAVTIGVPSEDASNAAVDALAARGLSGEDEVTPVAAEIASWWLEYKDLSDAGMQHGS